MQTKTKRFVLLFLTGTMLSFVSCSQNSSKEIIQEESISDVKSKKEFSIGTVENNVYENDFIGIGCALDENWNFYSYEEIMEINNYVVDRAGEDFEESMRKANIVYDMAATSSNQLENININLQKTSTDEINDSHIEDILEASIPSVKNTSANMGYTNQYCQIETINIGDKELPCLYLCDEKEGLKKHQKIFLIICDGYLSAITITTVQENTIDSVAENFYFIN